MIALLFATLFAVEPASEPEVPEVDMVIGADQTVPAPILYGEPVRRITANSFGDWRVVDKQRLIVYRTRSKPYLITLRRPAPRMHSASFIGIKTRSSWIDAGFDSVYIEDWPYQIERIEKITREVADHLLGRDQREDD